jgi:hypothetical protein
MSACTIFKVRDTMASARCDLVQEQDITEHGSPDGPVYWVRRRLVMELPTDVKTSSIVVLSAL